MGQSFLAIIDPTGLRVLLPENEAALKIYEQVRTRLRNSVGFWTVLGVDILPSLTDLLDQGDTVEALRLLRSQVVDGGPIIAD